MKDKKNNDEIFNSWLINKPIAHRGFHDKKFPENTIPSFENAIQKGYVVELDIQATEDNIIVVFHDQELDRLTGVEGTIQRCNYDFLKPLYVLKTKEHIPTLKEVLEVVNGRTPLLIEIKDYSRKRIAPLVWEVLKNYKGEVAIQSFNPFELKSFRKIAPHIKRGQISCCFRHGERKFIGKSLLRRMVFNKNVSKPDFIVYRVEDLPNRFVDKYRKLPLLAWTIKSQEQYENTRKLYDNLIFEGFEINVKTDIVE